jgi:hypothetical protein
MSRFVAFPANTVRLWRSGHVVKSVEGWSPVHKYVRSSMRSSALHDDIDTLRAHLEGLAPSGYPLSPEDERRRKNLKKFWTKMTPSGVAYPSRV